MAENEILAQILAGISTLELDKIDAVLDAVKARRLQVRANGNSLEKIRLNKEIYDYSQVPPNELPMAEKWYMADQPPSAMTTEYKLWRKWNVEVGSRGKVNKGYRGKFIKERATGQNVSQPEIEDFVHEDSDCEDEVTEVREAMAGVRVE